MRARLAKLGIPGNPCSSGRVFCLCATAVAQCIGSSLLRDKDTTSSKAHLPLPGDRGIELLEDRNSLEASLRSLHKEVGHGHPSALDVEFRLATTLHTLGELSLAREAFEEVLDYRSLLDGDQGTTTATVARDLFRLLCEQGDRPAMAEVYYRFLSWIPMRDPVLLSDELGVILQDVEYLLAQTSLGRMDPAPKTRG